MEGEFNTTAERDPEMTGFDTNTSKFAESYASFNRIINGLQRQYIELKEEFSTQNEKLAESNRRLVELTESNLAANEFLNGILLSIPVGVITVDREGNVTHLNPAGSKMLNKKASQAVGRHYRELIPVSDESTSGALAAIKTGEGTTSAEMSLALDGVRKLQVSVSTAILKDEVGNCVGAVEVIQDLTKIRRMEHEIARLNTLAALGEMAATIAHEVRNPLSGIGGFAALLERDFDKDDPKIALIHKIKKGVETLNHTVTKLLNYTRFNELNRTETDFVLYLKTAVEQFGNEQAATGQHTIVVFDDNNFTKPNDVIVSLDKILFRQSLFNVLTNSVEASGPNARISMSVTIHAPEKIPAPLASKINLDFDEVLLELTVSDNGPGIKPEHRDKIFAPFFTTKSSGSGLGLAVAWKLVKSHGGDIVLGKSTNAGTVFHILLPARLGNTQLESNL